jgi:hypothetical protein
LAGVASPVTRFHLNIKDVSLVAEVNTEGAAGAVLVVEE